MRARTMVAALGVSLVLVTSACANPPTDIGAAAGEGTVRGWEPLPTSPLSPRYGAHAFVVGERVLVIGGTNAPPCPPGADCVISEVPPFSDGALFDPVARTWTPIAEAPLPLGVLNGTVVGDTVFVMTLGFEPAPGVRAAFLAYDAAEDRWAELPTPPVGEDASWLTLAPFGNDVVAYPASHEVREQPDLVFDTSTRTWSQVPPDPLRPAFDRTMVWSGSELLLTSIDLVPQPGSDGPALYRAAALDPASGEWRTFPTSEVSGYDPAWIWAGDRLVNPTPGSSDGGGVNGWDRPYDHGGVLDPRAGTWSTLPPAPAMQHGWWLRSTGAGDVVLSAAGGLLHVPSGAWTALEPPQGAASEGAAVAVVAGVVVVWGGVRWDGSDLDASPTILGGGWIWAS